MTVISTLILVRRRLPINALMSVSPRDTVVNLANMLCL